ncbi:hypothetical protein KI387_044152, partial [Taxus chinensis]
ESKLLIQKLYDASDLALQNGGFTNRRLMAAKINEILSRDKASVKCQNLLAQLRQ